MMKQILEAVASALDNFERIYKQSEGERGAGVCHCDNVGVSLRWCVCVSLRWMVCVCVCHCDGVCVTVCMCGCGCS